MDELLRAERADPRYAQLLPANILRSIRGEDWLAAGRRPPQAPPHPLPGLVIERTHYLGAAHPGLTRAMTGRAQPHEVVARADAGGRVRRATRRWAQVYRFNEKNMLSRKRKLEEADG